MAEDYVCTLSPQALEKAKRELNEDPANRLGAVQTLREWVEQQPHLVFDTCKYENSNYMVCLTRVSIKQQLHCVWHLVFDMIV